MISYDYYRIPLKFVGLEKDAVDSNYCETYMHFNLEWMEMGLQNNYNRKSKL